MQPFFLRVTSVSFFIFGLNLLWPLPAMAATNLLTNPGAETGDLSGWTATSGLGIISGHDNGWAVGGAAHGGSYGFVSSYAAGDTSSFDILSQEINLAVKGYSNDEMDREPEITIDSYVAGLDGGSGTDDRYRVKVELRDKNHVVVASYDTGDQTATGSWTRISHTFSGYGEGVRYIYFEQDGRSSAWWDGNYGAIFDDASVIVGDVSEESATIDSWNAEILEEKGDCPQKLKLTIKGKDFNKDAKVSIGDHEASSVRVLSSKNLTAKFCLEKLSAKKLLKKSISVKNPHTNEEKANKKIDLSLVLLFSSPEKSFDQETHNGVMNIQKVLVSFNLLSSEDVLGVYGPKTVAAVKVFQTGHGIPVTGNVGPKTIAAFQEIFLR